MDIGKLKPKVKNAQKARHGSPYKEKEETYILEGYIIKQHPLVAVSSRPSD